jgi:uncharacterized protein YukE
MGFDLRADPAALQNVGNVVGEDARALGDEAKNLMAIVENLKSIWQDEANTIYVNDATEYLQVLQAIIDALENHGIYLVRTGAHIGDTVDKLKNKMTQMANM